MGAVTRRRPISAQPLGTRRHRPDYWLLLISAVLLAIGVVVVYSITPALSVGREVSGNHYVVRQLIAVGLSIVAFAVAAFVPLEVWRRAYKPLLIAAGIVTLFALVLPVSPLYPAHRWVRLGGLSFQSVELLKFALLIWMAGLLSNSIVRGTAQSVQQAFKPLGIGLIATGIVVAGIQSDFGSMVVIVAMMAAMVFVAGLPIRRILMVGGIVALVGVLAISVVPYRRDRIAAFLQQGNVADCASLQTGYQACRALVAVGSGGMVGLGLGNSVQAFGYLPESANDSIFAIYAEKFGFVGVTVLLGLLLVFMARIKRVMERAPDGFTRLLATGAFAWLATQSLINIGAMLGVLPLKGITLPFISYGGTSVVFVMALVGVVFQISRYTLYSVPRQTEVINRRTVYEGTGDRRRVRGAYHPGPGSRT
ncbi:MAG TPA: putative peptidoglycan glycosyltransferase FtsW [Candidatus Saccharimonadales bacterium]